MRFSELLATLPPALAPSSIAQPLSGDPAIRSLTYDSRRVAPGELFVALRGVHTDGHAYLPQALRLGASALLVEAWPTDLSRGEVAVAVVPDTRRALAPIAAAFFGHPARELTLIGVTGTNGKTSTTYLVEAMLKQAGRRVGLIGTVEVRYGEVRQRSINTTPESLDFQHTLRAMRNRGVEIVVMEVSSHGLALGRIAGCGFGVAAMTNVTQDHLDFHGDMDAYLRSKLLLFQQHLNKDGGAIVNLDDAAAAMFLAAAESAGARVVRVSQRADSEADIRIENSSITLDGSDVTLRTPSETLALHLPLVGAFNLENLLVAAGIAWALGLPSEAIARGAAACLQVPGRVERVENSAGAAPAVFVDYAHTPDAVEKLLCALRPLTRGRLIAVFGCGGDRDRGKRPLMARAVARWADCAIATSDNPRTENPESILDDVARGLGEMRRVEPAELRTGRGCYARVSDRRSAIELAIAAAQLKDTVVIAGKGHEDYQIIGHEHLPFDDRREARRALMQRAKQ